MGNKRSEIIAEITTRQSLDAEITNRLNLVAEIESRQNLEAEITTKQEIIAMVETRVVEGGYYASVQNGTLHLQKEISVDGNELMING